VPPAIEDDELLEALFLIAHGKRDALEEWLIQHPKVRIVVDWKR
jgi:hypothetical protein